MKFCKNCNEYKDILTDFRICKYKSGKLYYKNICKKCESVIQINRIKANGLSDKAKKTNVEWKKRWRANNRELYNKRCREAMINKPELRIRKNVSRAILGALKTNSAAKKSSFLPYVNYTMSELKKHIESKFENEMNWDNYGSYWHIDHIIPQSCLPYMSMEEDNFKKCWDLNNLRPLEAKVNMSDGATRIRHINIIGENNG